MSVDGAWEGDPCSTPCEMGGGPLVDYRTLVRRGYIGGGKTTDQAIKTALQLATGCGVIFVCATKAEGERMRQRVEGVLYWAECFPVKKYTAKFEIKAVKK